MYLFWRYHVENEPRPDFSESRNWFNIKLLKTRKGSKESAMSYDAHLNAVKKCLESLNIVSTNKTHMGRGSSIRMAESRGASGLKQQGRWGKGSMEGCYSSCLPREAMRALAGFNVKGGDFYIKRDIVPVPDDLLSEVFPWVDEGLSWQKNPLNNGTVCAVGFLELCKYLRKVLIQDAAVMYGKWNHKLWEHNLFRSSLFLQYRTKLLEAMKIVRNPDEDKLEKCLPDLMKFLNESVLQLLRKNDRQSQEQQDLLQKVLEKVDESNTDMQCLSSGLAQVVNDWQSRISRRLTVQGGQSLSLIQEPMAQEFAAQEPLVGDNAVSLV